MKFTPVMITGGVLVGLQAALLTFAGLSSAWNLIPAAMVGLLFYSENKDQFSQ